MYTTDDGSVYRSDEVKGIVAEVARDGRYPDVWYVSLTDIEDAPEEMLRFIGAFRHMNLDEAKAVGLEERDAYARDHAI